MVAAIITTMTEAAAATHEERSLALLLAWFSPALPIGAFSYSHGLEALLESGGLNNRADAEAVIKVALLDGAGWSDAVMLAHAYGATIAHDQELFDEVAALALALSPSRERHEETANQGNAFAQIVADVWPADALRLPEGAVALPIAVGAAGAAHKVALVPLLQAFASAFAANLISAAVRLVPLGQTDGQRLTRDLAPVAADVARRAADAPIRDIGGAAFGLDLASMRHEYQDVRLFRS